MRRLLLAGFVAIVTGCGDDAPPPVCGNGVPETGEQCDDGNTRDDDACSNMCRSRATNDAQVVWTLVSQELPGFNETCGGVMASEIELHLVGPGTDVTERSACSDGQRFFVALADGEYTVNGRLYDSAGAAVTTGVAQTTFAVTGADVSATLDFPYADFTRQYMGDYFFRVRWAGADMCAAALPPVTQHVLRLERGGVALAGMTNNGDPIDGSAPGMCRDAATTVNQFPQSINDLPWGPAEMTVEGLDATGTPQFRETFPTFVGAGLANPELQLDVNSLAPDAGVPDAAPVDATATDAM